MWVEVGQSLEGRRERGREEGSEIRRGYQLKTEVVLKNTGLIRIEQRPQEKRRAQACMGGDTSHHDECTRVDGIQGEVRKDSLLH
jgi:hypothetical protein